MRARPFWRAWASPPPAQEWPESEEEAVEIFQSLGTPVAMKVLSPEVVHKSDAGGVKLNLKDADEVRTAYREITAAFLDKKSRASLCRRWPGPGLRPSWEWPRMPPSGRC